MEGGRAEDTGMGRERGRGGDGDLALFCWPAILRRPPAVRFPTSVPDPEGVRAIEYPEVIGATILVL